MSLVPDNDSETLDQYLERINEEEPQPSLTYKIDFETGRIGGLIDGKEAVKQFIHKALITARSKYRIYNDQYGCELPPLIGSDVTDGFLKAEIPRMVKEALIYDNRIISVNKITADRRGDAVFIMCTVTTIYGDFKQEVVV